MIAGCISETNAEQSSKFQWIYYVGMVDHNRVTEFKTETGTVCVMASAKNDWPVSISCSFDANSHAK